MSDMAELFSRDPLKLTQDDLAAIVARYREARSQFNLGEKSAGSTKKVAAPKGPKVQQLDLDDLLS